MAQDDPEDRLQARRLQLMAERTVLQSRMATSHLHEDPFLTNQLEKLEAAIDQIDAALAQSNLTHAIQTEAAAREMAARSEENANFWFRRFMLSLQIGNGAGFLATAAVVGQVDAAAISLAAVLAWAPAAYFGLGTAAAGLLPLIMAALVWAEGRPNARRAAYVAAWFMTTSAIGFFACGMTSVVFELRQLGQPAVMHAAEPAQAPSPIPAPPLPDGDPSDTPPG